MNLNVKDEMKINFYNKKSRERIRKIQNRKKSADRAKKVCLNKNSQYWVGGGGVFIIVQSCICKS